jgi:hypothetical protein
MVNLESARTARDRSFEHRRYRASGFNLITAAIVLWNTTYIERATRTFVSPWPGDENLLQYLWPLGRATSI